MPRFGVVMATLVTLLSLDSISIGFITTQTIHAKMREHRAGKELPAPGQPNGLLATVVKLQVNLVVLAAAVMLFFEAANALPKFIGVFFGAQTLQAISQVVG